MTPAAKSFPSAGKRLAAAMHSFQVGYTGVDRMLKRYGDKSIDPWWEKKAKQLLREIERRRLGARSPQPPRMQHM